MPPFAWQQWQPVTPDPDQQDQGPGLLTPVDLASMAQMYLGPPSPPVAPPVPYAPKPSVVDRVLGRLFPAPGLADQGTQAVRHQGLLELGARLMAGGGPSPVKRGTLANIGTAVGGTLQDLPSIVTQAMQAQAYQKAQQDAAAQDALIASLKPPAPGQDLQAWIESTVGQHPELIKYPAQVKNLLELHQLLQDKKGAGDWLPYANPVSGEMYRFNKRSGKLESAGAVGQSKLLGPAAKPDLSAAELPAARQVVAALQQQNALEDADQTAGVTPAGYAAAQGIANIGILGGHPLSGVAGPVAQQMLTPAQAEFQRAAVTARHHYLSLLPHSRGSLGILEDINKATTAPAGQTDPGVLKSYRQARNDIITQLQARIAATEAAGGTKAPLPAPSAPPAAPAPTGPPPVPVAPVPPTTGTKPNPAKYLGRPFRP